MRSFQLWTGLAAGIAALIATAAPATAETYDEGVQRKVQQEQQGDMIFASNCLQVSMTLNIAAPDAASGIYGEGGAASAQTQETFWSTYLERLGHPGLGVDEAQLTQLAKKLEENPSAAAAVLSPTWMQCTQAHDYLTEYACPFTAGEKPVGFHLTMGNIGLARMCRESAQMSSEGTLKDEYKDDPAAQARFNAQQQAYIKERDHFDALLAAQPAPQCPKSPGPFLSAIFPTERKQVEDAYQAWINGLNTQDDMTSSQMPYIQWQTACGQLKDITGFEAE